MPSAEVNDESGSTKRHSAYITPSIFMWPIGAIIFGLARNWIGFAAFAGIASLSIIMGLAKISPRKRITGRLYRSAVIQFSGFVVLFAVGVDFMTQGRWVESLIFFGLSTVPWAMSATVFKIARKSGGRSHT